MYYELANSGDGSTYYLCAHGTVKADTLVYEMHIQESFSHQTIIT